MKARNFNQISLPTILQSRGGFTLVEIVVVVAIAALILGALLVFIPQAQNAQQDGQRRQAAEQIVAKAQEFAGNNRGVYPGSSDIGGTGSFTTTYIAPIKIDTTHSGSSCTWGTSVPTTLSPGVCQIITSGTQIDVYMGLTRNLVFDGKNY